MDSIVIKFMGKLLNTNRFRQSRGGEVGDVQELIFVLTTPFKARYNYVNVCALKEKSVVNKEE